MVQIIRTANGLSWKDSDDVETLPIEINCELENNWMSQLIQRHHIDISLPMIIVMENDQKGVQGLVGAWKFKLRCVLLSKSRIHWIDYVTFAIGAAYILRLDTTATDYQFEDIRSSTTERRPSWCDAVDPDCSGVVGLLTSGSIRNHPKIAISSWEALVRQGEATEAQMFGGVSCRLVCATSITHAYAINAVFAVLASNRNSKLVLASSASSIMEVLQHQGLRTILFGTPATYVQLIDQDGPIYVDKAYCAGVHLPRSLFEAMESKFHVSLLQNYGCTECGSISAEGLESHSAAEKTEYYVGKAWPGVEIVQSQEGEIRVKTPWMCKGYVEGKQLVPITEYHPTGDIGTIEDANVWIKNRIRPAIVRDHVTIDRHSIENQIRNHPSVADAVVPIHKDDSVFEVWVLVYPETPSSESDILQWCRENCPHGEYIDLLRIVDHFPCSPAGKLMYHSNKNN